MPSYRLLTSVVLLILLTAVAVTLAQPTQSAPNATFTVTTADDSDDGLCDDHCSLREAITAANTIPSADTITFAPYLNETITLSGSQLPLISGTLTIDAAPGLTIDAADNSRIFEIAGAAAVTITHLTLANGHSFIYGGGAISNQGILTLRHNTFYNNVARACGAISNSGWLHVSDATFYENGAEFYGSAICNSGTLTLRNATLTANHSGEGATVLNTNYLIIINSTFVGNWTDGTVAGIDNWGTSPLSLHNTVITSNGGADCNGYLILDTVNNLIGDGSCGAILGGDPQLGPLQDNGGYTWTHAPLPGSPLLDAGHNEACPPTDQRGISRPFDGDGDGVSTCDIGAVEAVGPVSFYLPAVWKP